MVLLDAQVALDFFLNRVSEAGLRAATVRATATRLLHQVAPSDFPFLTAEKLLGIAPELSAAEADRLAEAAARFVHKPVSVLVIASPFVAKVTVTSVVEYLRYRLPGETVLADHAQQMPADTAVRAARSCAVVLCLIDENFFTDERALTALTWAYLTKAQVRGARVPMGDDTTAYKNFCRLAQIGGPQSLPTLVGADLVARLDDGTAFSASDLFGALVALADSFPRVAALDHLGRVDALPALIKNVGLERAFPATQLGPPPPPPQQQQPVPMPMPLNFGYGMPPSFGLAPPPVFYGAQPHSFSLPVFPHSAWMSQFPPFVSPSSLPPLPPAPPLPLSLQSAPPSLLSAPPSRQSAPPSLLSAPPSPRSQLQSAKRAKTTAKASKAASRSDDDDDDRAADNGTAGDDDDVEEDDGDSDDDDDDYREDNHRPSPAVAAAATGRWGHRRAVRPVPFDELERVAASSRNGWTHVRLTDTAPVNNVGSMLCRSLLAAGRVLVAWGFVSSVAAAANILGCRRKRGELSGIVYGRVKFVFEEPEANIPRLGDAAAAQSPTSAGVRVVRPLPLDELQRLARTTDPRHAEVHVRLTDSMPGLDGVGSIVCHSLHAAGRVFEAWGFATRADVGTKMLREQLNRGARVGRLFHRIDFEVDEGALVKPPRVISIVPRETLDRLANTVDKGPRGIKVQLVDVQRQLGDIRCDSLHGAGRVLEAWGFTDSAGAMATSLRSRFRRGDVTGCLFDRIQYQMEDDRVRSGKEATVFVPMHELQRLASTRDPQQKAIRVRLSDTVEQGNLGSVLCHSLKGAGRVLHAWGFAPASLHTPLKERKKRGEVTGLLYKRIQFRFE